MQITFFVGVLAFVEELDRVVPGTAFRLLTNRFNGEGKGNSDGEQYDGQKSLPVSRLAGNGTKVHAVCAS